MGGCFGKHEEIEEPVKKTNKKQQGKKQQEKKQQEKKQKNSGASCKTENSTGT